MTHVSGLSFENIVIATELIQNRLILSQSRTKGFFRAIFLDLFLIIFVRAF